MSRSILGGNPHGSSQDQAGGEGTAPHTLLVPDCGPRSLQPTALTPNKRLFLITRGR